MKQEERDERNRVDLTIGFAVNDLEFRSAKDKDAFYTATCQTARKVVPKGSPASEVKAFVKTEYDACVGFHPTKSAIRD